MPKQSLTKNLVKQRLATVELAQSKLDNDYQETTYRHNQLVADCIKSAREELDEAFEKLYEDNLQRAFDLAGIAWLHTDFGRQLLDAEAIEHILGRKQLPGTERSHVPWESKARQLFAFSNQEIKTLREETAPATENEIKMPFQLPEPFLIGWNDATLEQKIEKLIADISEMSSTARQRCSTACAFAEASEEGGRRI